MAESAELREALDQLHAVLDDRAARGLRTAGPRDLAYGSSPKERSGSINARGDAERGERAYGYLRLL